MKALKIISLSLPFLSLAPALAMADCLPIYTLDSGMVVAALQSEAFLEMDPLGEMGVGEERRGSTKLQTVELKRFSATSATVNVTHKVILENPREEISFLATFVVGQTCKGKLEVMRRYGTPRE
jgi:hypothetical protein